MTARPEVGFHGKPTPRTMSADFETRVRLTMLDFDSGSRDDFRMALRIVVDELDAERAAHAATAQQVADLTAALDGAANTLEAEVRRADGSGAHLQTLVDYCRAALARAHGAPGGEAGGAHPAGRLGSSTKGRD